MKGFFRGLKSAIGAKIRHFLDFAWKVGPELSKLLPVTLPYRARIVETSTDWAQVSTKNMEVSTADTEVSTKTNQGSTNPNQPSTNSLRLGNYLFKLSVLIA